jgi:hypothetical protein
VTRQEFTRNGKRLLGGLAALVVAMTLYGSHVAAYDAGERAGRASLHEWLRCRDLAEAGEHALCDRLYAPTDNDEF